MSQTVNFQQAIPLTLKLRILGKSVEITVDAPSGQVRLDEVLPLLRKIDDIAIDCAVEQSESSGKGISCCRGCDACCRAQPVPVTPAEAYAIWRLVEGLPEPRRTEIRNSFKDRANRLLAAGLAQVYLDRDPELSKDDARIIASRYFNLRLACPFLTEHGVCGIYEERPFVCRQYLVTSPAELCANPFENSVEVLPTPLAPASALLEVSTIRLGREQFTIPLTLALEYVEKHRQELETTVKSQDLVTDCLQEMFGRRSDCTP